ncbi:hypothetical protein SAMN04488122_3015 [Chitinophaga arvensicola]|uniref:Uncharacterized protein n=1 Tax=Chitinophaga arvensicola TaxID=29529 RepID=A0A1I0RLF3_9BACT|nr:hypothetical protein SAMN04488122_3015 [Chitinophaga arvensicola]
MKAGISAYISLNFYFKSTIPFLSKVNCAYYYLVAGALTR